MPEPERPRLPAGYGEFDPFTIETAPSWDNVEPRLEVARNYWVTTSDEHGPHSVPVWGLWFDLAFMFATDKNSRKARALAVDARCQVHLESGDDVVIVHGRSEPLSEDVLDRFVHAYFIKYGVPIDPDDPIHMFIRIVPTYALTWLEQDFQRSAARWTF